MDWTKYESKKLFALRDSCARLVCENLLEGKTKLANSILRDFEDAKKEIERRISDV